MARTTRGRAQDRKRVAGGQDYEVRYEWRSLASISQVRAISSNKSSRARPPSCSAREGSAANTLFGQSASVAANSFRVNAQCLFRHAMFLAASERSRCCRHLSFSKCGDFFSYHSRSFDFGLCAALSDAQTAKQHHCLGIPTHPRCLRR
jgi:hypothetical protein